MTSAKAMRYAHEALALDGKTLLTINGIPKLAYFYWNKTMDTGWLAVSPASQYSHTGSLTLLLPEYFRPRVGARNMAMMRRRFRFIAAVAHPRQLRELLEYTKDTMWYEEAKKAWEGLADE